MTLTRTPARAPLTGVPTLWLLAALALVMLPYLLRLPVWMAALCAGLLGWKALITVRGWAQPSLLILAGLAVLLIGGTLNAYGTILGRDGGTALLIGLVLLKLLESRTRRDALLLALLGFFCATANFFFAQDVQTALYTLLTLLALLAALGQWGHIPSPQPPTPARATLSRTALLLLQAAPLAALLFFLFPRPAGPLWTLPAPSSTAQSGLSDTMSPGTVSNLVKSDAVAFRVEFEGPQPPPETLYWRGPVLERFDGQIWTQGPFDLRTPLLEARGGDIGYTLTLEPSGLPWVLALDVPSRLEGAVRLTNRFQVVALPTPERRRFHLHSVTSYYAGRQEYPERLQAALALPADGNPQARALAASWAALPPSERVSRAVAYFARGGFQYTLEPPLLPEQDGLDAFLFGTKQGFCEFYAGAFTFLMRAAGVPARVVTGYLGGEQGAGGYLIVRQSAAHAWSEVWLEGEGWRRIDPTAVVAPARLSEGVAQAVSDPGALSVLSRAEGGLLRSLALRLDALQTTWNDWIVGYDGARQRSLLERLGLGEVGGWRYTLALLAALLLCVALMLLVLRRRRLEHPDPVQRAWLGLLERLKLSPAPSETARSLSKRASAQFPSSAGEIHALAEEYERLRYADLEREKASRAGKVRAFARRARRLRVRREQG